MQHSLRSCRVTLFTNYQLPKTDIRNRELPKRNVCKISGRQNTKIMQFRVKSTVHRPILGCVPDWSENQKFFTGPKVLYWIFIFSCHVRLTQQSYEPKAHQQKDLSSSVWASGPTLTATQVDFFSNKAKKYCGKTNPPPSHQASMPFQW